MKLILLALAVLLGAILALYLFAPRVLFNTARNALRRKSGLVRKSIAVDGLDWPYLEAGSAQAEPVVLVHGFGGDKDNWAFYAPNLVGRYRLICPDLPAFGEATRNPELDYSAARQTERLKDFLDALGIEKCHLGGNSMGGYIALLFALRYPERLRSLTLFNNAGVLGAEPSELQAMVESEPESSPLVPRTPGEIGDLLAFVVHRPRFIPGRFLTLLHGDVAPHIPLLDRIFAQLLDDMLNRPLNDRIAQVSVPTQIIWGRHDRLIDVSCAHEQHQAIKDSELVVFEDVGHVPMIEKPAQTARHHLAFLAKH